LRLQLPLSNLRPALLLPLLLPPLLLLLLFLLAAARNDQGESGGPLPPEAGEAAAGEISQVGDTSGKETRAVDGAMKRVPPGPPVHLQLQADFER
jgi:hypothetical protein